MDKNKSLLIAGIVFGIIALAHFMRALLSWNILISGFSVPVYLSYLTALILGYLAWQMFSASKV